MWKGIFKISFLLPSQYLINHSKHLSLGIIIWFVHLHLLLAVERCVQTCMWGQSAGLLGLETFLTRQYQNLLCLLSDSPNKYIYIYISSEIGEQMKTNKIKIHANKFQLIIGFLYLFFWLKIAIKMSFPVCYWAERNDII